MAGMFDDLIPPGQPQAAPSEGGMFDDLIPQKSGVADFFQSIPRGVLRGLANTASASGNAAQIEMGQPITGPSGPEGTSLLEQNVTGNLPQPQGMAGRFGASIGESLGNPGSYIGPGGLPLKIGGAILSGAGGQAGEETGLPGGRFLGSLAGGVTAAKTLGPKAATAAIPTAPELKAAAKEGYKQAADSGLQIAPSGLYQVAENAKQELLREGFDPESKVFKVIGAAQQIPESSEHYVSSQTFDIFNKRLQRIAGETQMGRSGPEPTPDAAAAQTALQHFRDYGQNIPERDVVAGSPQAYRDAVGQANQNYAAYKRTQGFDYRLNKAENANDRNVGGSIGDQIRRTVGTALDKPGAINGLNNQELGQIKQINGAWTPSNVLPNLMRQAGRGGAAQVIPIAAQLAAAAHTGGASLPIWATMVGARLGDNALTKARAQTLIDTLAKRSPLYASRLKALSTTSMAPNWAQIGRSGLLGLQ